VSYLLTILPIFFLLLLVGIFRSTPGTTREEIEERWLFQEIQRRRDAELRRDV
jgi:hypothetical protein